MPIPLIQASIFTVYCNDNNDNNNDNNNNTSDNDNDNDNDNDRYLDSHRNF